MSATRYLVFVTVSVGLEAALASELAELGLSSEAKEGGVEVWVTLPQLHAIALSSRLAEGLRIRLKSFVARDFDALEEGLSRLPFRAYFAPGSVLKIRVVSHRSRLWHTGAVRERVAQFLTERCELKDVRDASRDEEEAAEFQEAESTLYVRITGDAVQISVDAGGRMHRRGYRIHVEAASLRETLAAALVRSASGLGGAAAPPAIWDPFLGSGTVLCEAAAYFGGILPGGLRRFPFESFPTHDPVEFELARQHLEKSAAERAQQFGFLPRFLGSDISEKALASAQHNFAALGTSGKLEIFYSDFEEALPMVPAGSWVLSNPPYGVRLSERNVIPRLERALKARTDLRPVVLLVGDAARRKLPSAYRTLFSTKNGGLSVAIRGLA